MKAYYHLPGLFEFYELYKLFLPLYREHREYFHDWCEIGSIYGAPGDALWGGGRVGFGDADPHKVHALMNEYGISARLTFSNLLVREEHLSDRRCNQLCELFSQSSTAANGVIIASDLLLDYIREHYPSFYFVSSTTKVITDMGLLINELNNDDYRFVVPDFRLNSTYDKLCSLTDAQKEKLELLCNECCSPACTDRRRCYENVSAKNLGEDIEDHICRFHGSSNGYRFSDAMESPCFIGTADILGRYLPNGISNFKIEGRSLGSAIVLEFLLYYMTKPGYQLKVREAIYLDSSLDLF
ncbi:hypothetical protein [Butyrivibrio sp. MC2013]|uniref:hypothetical protein n=1 Tax=Butyrivibrio sp. MC2013 TaxID=1280686 RepID=UPI0003F9D121|nr:hypothetical protein [Butyrivibrio sp. MC2013]